MKQHAIALAARWGFALFAATTPTSRWGLFLLLVVSSGLVFSVCAEHEGPWPRHTIDNSSRGADGVRLADANGDGLMDIATGWEEGGIVRLYLNPGPEKPKDKWPAVTVGKVKNVEDAVMVDLDGDGAIDVVSSCEGKTKTMYVHWGPKDEEKLLDEDAWVTEAIPATVGKQMWMYCLPHDVDQKYATDLVVGSKGKGAAVGWLQSPRKARDLKDWTYHKLWDAGWIMSLEEDTNRRQSRGVLVTDRMGPNRGASALILDENNIWLGQDLERGNTEYMFGCAAAHLPGWIVATRNGSLRMFTENDEDTTIQTGKWLTTQTIPNPFGIKHGKAVTTGDIDHDKISDLVVSFNTQNQKDKPGVAWIKVLPDKDPKDWPAYDISGLEGKKFDRLELIDLDGDGDLDVLTCEEAENLGVIWYENPYGKQKQE
jgi:hypothetical protein